MLTRDQLISLTFNDEFDGFDRAIDSQVARLRRQISRDGRQPIQTVYGTGYKFVVERRLRARPTISSRKWTSCADS